MKGSPMKDNNRLLADRAERTARALSRIHYTKISCECAAQRRSESLEAIERSRKLLAVPVFDPFRLPQGGAGSR
ncbi:hypothetical protein [Methylobacterium nodulans]|nr:hypothetical protein [Methylobacterium nodulans]